MFELTPFAGTRSVNTLRRDMDDLWTRFFDNQGQSHGMAFVPTVNIKETEKAIEVTADMPGLKPEDIEVNLTGNILTIKGTKKAETKEDKANYHLIERTSGYFARSFRLPVDVDRDQVQAKNKDGILTVTLPKAAKEVRASIKVESSE